MWKQGCHFLLCTQSTTTHMSSRMNWMNCEPVWFWLRVSFVTFYMWGGNCDINSNNFTPFTAVCPYFLSTPEHFFLNYTFRFWTLTTAQLLWFGPFWPQFGLMGILRLSAPHSTQSEDVWPPSESIPEGKINYTGGGKVALYYGWWREDRQMGSVKETPSSWW